MKKILPETIAANYAQNKFRGEFTAVVMFLDISGFTVMTETLMKTGKEGAEVLSQILNNVFEPVIKIIYAYGGFISTFAGDAFTAVFPCSGKEKRQMEQSCCRVGRMILQSFKDNGVIKSRLGNFELGVKIGLYSGMAEWCIVRGSGPCGYYFRGDGIELAALAEQQAARGELVLMPGLQIDKNCNSVTNPAGYQIVHEPLAVKYPLIPSGIEISAETAGAFFPDSILNFNDQGEFRQVVPVFISFESRNNQDELDEYLGFVIDMAALHHGYFNKIDFGDKGGVVLVVFGAPRSLENNIEPALDFLLDMKKYSGPVSWRAGISYGTVYAGMVGSDQRCEYTVLGKNVNLAARLMLAAAPGEILCPQEIFSAAAGRYSFAEGRDLILKGIAGSVTAMPLLSFRNLSSESQELHFTGREHELTLLDQELAGVRGQKVSRVVFAAGEAGIGKTRLLLHFCNKNNLRYHYFYTNPVLKKAFGSFEQFLREYFQQTVSKTDENLDSFTKIYRRLLISCKKNSPALLPELRRIESLIAGFIGIKLPDSLYFLIDPSEILTALCAALSILLEAMLSDGCELFLVEDWQWLDNNSKELFLEILEKFKEKPVLFVITARGKNSPAELKQVSENCFSELILTSFTAGEIDTFFTRRFKLKLDNSLRDFLLLKTGGNPFYCEQFGLFLQANNCLKTENGITTLAIPPDRVPDSITDIMVARIDALDDEIKRAVKAASVLHNEFDKSMFLEFLKLLDQLDNCSDFSAAGLGESVLKGGTEAEIWENITEIRYAFRHLMLKEAAYGMQLTSRLKKMHSTAGDLLKELFGELSKYYPDIAYHYQQGGCNNQSAEFWSRAAETELELYNFDTATEYVQNGLLQLKKKQNVDIRVKLALYENMASCYRLQGNLEEGLSWQNRALRLSRQLKDPVFHAKILNFKGLFYKDGGEYKQALKCYRKAETLICDLPEADPDDLGGIYNNYGYACVSLSRFKPALQYFEKALESFSKLSSESVDMAKTYNNISNLYFRKGQLEKAFDFADKAMQVFEKILPANHYLRAMMLNNLATYNHQAGKYQLAADYLLEAEKSFIATMGPNNKDLAMLYNNLAAVYEAAGDYDQAGFYYESALAIFHRLNAGHSLDASYLYNNLSLVKAKFADFEQAYRLGRESLEIQKEILGPDSIDLVISYANLSTFARDLADFEEAQSFLQTAMDLTSKYLTGANFYSQALALGQGKLCFLQGQFTRASEWLYKAISESEELGEQNRITSAYAYTALSAYHAGDFKELESLCGKLVSKYAIDGIDYEYGMVQTVQALAGFANSYKLEPAMIDKLRKTFDEGARISRQNLNFETLIFNRYYLAVLEIKSMKSPISENRYYQEAVKIAKENRRFAMLGWLKDRIED